MALIYDKPYWPETFDIEMPEVQKAIEMAIEYGGYSVSKAQTVLEKGHGYCRALGCWLDDNEIAGKEDKSGLRELKVKSYEEAVKKWSRERDLNS